MRQFARIGAVIVGVIGGSISVSNEHSAQLATYKAKLAERDGEIAELKAAISKREMEKNGISSGVVSSGDPVQDWIDSLVE